MRKLALYLLFFLPASVLAHPGHDHAHWFSGAFHLIAIMAIAGVIAAAVVLFSKKRAVQKIEEDQQR